MTTTPQQQLSEDYEAACRRAAELYDAGADTTAIDARCDQLQVLIDALATPGSYCTVIGNGYGVVIITDDGPAAHFISSRECDQLMAAGLPYYDMARTSGDAAAISAIL